MKRFLLLLLILSHGVNSYSQPPISSQPCYLNLVDTNIIATYTREVHSTPLPLPPNPGFTDLSVTGTITFAIDYDNTAIIPSFTYGVVLFTTWYNAAGDTSYFNDTLWLHYSDSPSTTVTGKAFRRWDGAYKIETAIMQLLDENNDSIPFSNSLPPHLYVETSIELIRQNDFNQPDVPAFLTASLNPTTCAIEIVWAPVNWASFYELEWVYVDDYGNDNNGTQISKYALKYTFFNKAMRVRVRGYTEYKLPNVFRRGYMIFRVRAVQEQVETSNLGVSTYHLLYGNWTLSDNYNRLTRQPINVIATIPNAMNYVQIDGASSHEKSKNYFFAMRSDEEGKAFYTTTYYDGLTKQRQQVTLQSTDSVALITETIYDHAGRAAIATLPAPVKENCLLKYYPSFNRDSASGEKYSYEHFENSAGCIPMPNPFDSSSGAGKYYSGNNPFQSLYDGHHRYVPDAGGYPFIQTQYMPDNTGRIKASGMAGKTHQTGNGHETKYFYGQPPQEELNMLFGTDAGYRSFYQKTLSIDPNGQINISYSDAAGNTVATALAGTPPDSLEPLKKAPDYDTALYQTGKKITTTYINTFATPPHIEDNLAPYDSSSLSFNTTFLSAGNDLRTIHYEVQGEKFTDACIPDTCFDCIYELSLLLKDICGNTFINVQKDTLGDFPDTAANSQTLLCDANPASDTIHFLGTMDVGSYTLTKQLSIDEAAMEYYFRQYLAYNKCLPSLQDFIDSAFAQVDTIVCEIDCDNCGTGTAPLPEDTTGLTAILAGLGDSNDSLCEEICTDPGTDWCYIGYNMMLADVSPGGQYGKLPTGNPVDTINERTSVYYTGGNILYNHHEITGSYNPSNYKYPLIYIDSTWQQVYLDENGNKDTVWCNSLADCTSRVLLPFNVFSTTDGRYYTFPQHLTLEEFVLGKPSWAHSLVVYHPEYPYYWWCLQNVYNDTAMVDGKFLNTFEYDGFLLNLTRSDAYSSVLLSSSTTILTTDPFFKLGATGKKGVYQNYTTPFSWNIWGGNNPNFWYNNPNCINKPQWIPYDKMDDKIGNYSMSNSMFQVAYLSNYPCNSFPSPQTPFTLIHDSATWSTLITLYTGNKYDIMLRAASAFADSLHGLNTCMGDDAFYPYKAWEFHSYCGSFSWSAFHNSPGHNFRNPCSIRRYKYFAKKTKRFGTTQQLLSVDDALSDDSLRAFLENRLGYQYYQTTGNCPLAASLEGLLGGLAKDNYLFSPTHLSQCNYLTPAITDALGDTAFDWNPSVTGSGKILTAYLDPVPCPITLTLPADTPVTWYNTLISFSHIQTAGRIYGSDTVYFSILGTFSDANGNIVAVPLAGTTCIPIDTCTFEPECSITSEASDMMELLNILNFTGTLDTTANIDTLMPMSLWQYLGGGNEQWVYNNADNTANILNTHNGTFLQITFSQDLNTLPDSGIFVNIEASSPTPDNGCTPDFQLTYLSSPDGTSIDTTLITGTITTSRGEFIPIHCCFLPSFCKEISSPLIDPPQTNTQSTSDALLELLQSMIYPSTFTTDTFRLDKFAFYPALSFYYPGFNNVFIRHDTVRSASTDTSFYDALIYALICRDTGANVIPAPPYDTLCLHVDTLCSISFRKNDGSNFNMESITGFISLDPLMSEANVDGITYEFRLIFSTGVGFDTLFGQSCIPLKKCSDCLREANDGFIDHTIITDTMLIIATGINYGDTVINTIPISDISQYDNIKYIIIDTIFPDIIPVPLESCIPPSIPICLTDTGTGIASCLDSLFYDPCKENLYNIAQLNTEKLYELLIDSIHNDFVTRYKRQCLKAKELLTMRYTYNEYHFTLYYYDQSGNLVRTVPPKGAEPFTDSVTIALVDTRRNNKQTLVPSHTMTSETRYNSLNSATEEKTPDGGIVNKWYDKIGRIRASQNSKQKPGNKYSYTMYDYQSRVVETGEVTVPRTVRQRWPQQWVPQMMPMPVVTNITSYINNHNFPYNIPNSIKKDIVKTYFDTIAFTVPGFAQQHLRSRTSATTVDADGDTVYEHASHFSYDIHGNVNTLVQDNKELAAVVGSQQYKKIEYDYDLISNKVTTVKYQPGKDDAFYHQYTYDADNRLKEVYTSLSLSHFLNVSLSSLTWDNDARYFYYLHGPLARLEIGQQQVQGLDYAYTINGWTKGINSETLNETRDIGRDGDNNTPNLNKFFAHDVFGYVLRYFDNDYKPVSSIQQPASNFISSGMNIISLYNGNISSTTTVMNGLDKIGFNYKYDQLNRLMTSTAFNGLDTVSNTWNHNPLNDYQMKLSYDPNGNILSMTRNGISSINTLMDSLDYHYNSHNNQLRQVRDAIGATNYPDDIDDQTDTSNYQYDQIGNLVKDKSEEIDSIKWNIYGKVTEIKRTPTSTKPNLEFAYSGDGNRISKKVMFPSGSGVDETTYYTRDASGNIMAIYTLRSDTFSIDEHVIYGSSRLGVIKREKLLAVKGKTHTSSHGFPFSGTSIHVPGLSGILLAPGQPLHPLQPSQPGSSFTHTLGLKRYELDNWLGNVQVVISDRKLQVDTNSDGVVDWYRADVRSATDYYPFGMMMPGRNFNAENYRFGAFGYEGDNEVKGTGNSYTTEFRQYDSRIGRWWSVDPITYPWQSSYTAFDNNPVYFKDPKGSISEENDDKKDNKVAIDAGHGIQGSNNPIIDPGAVANNQMEKDLTLSIAQSVNKYLKSYEENTTMIRESDITVEGNSLLFRTNKAKEEDANIFVSIHINAASSENPRGFSVLYKNNGSNGNENQKLAENIANSQYTMGLNSSPTTVRNNLAILNSFSSTGPAALIEVGFITNPNDVQLMVNKHDDIGREIAEGIYKYMYGNLPQSKDYLLQNSTMDKETIYLRGLPK